LDSREFFVEKAPKAKAVRDVIKKLKSANVLEPFRRWALKSPLDKAKGCFKPWVRI